jgi:hypothetical protein
VLSKIPDVVLNEATNELTFSYYNQGDYDQNTEVNIADLTPLGANLGRSNTDPDWNGARAATDGDSNGVLNISDLTPIGANFFANIGSWNAYAGAAGDYPSSAADDNGAAAELESIPTSSLSAVDGISRRTATFQLSSAGFVGHEQFWLRPVGSDGEGIASDPFFLGVDITPPLWTDAGNPGVLAVAPHDASATVYWGEATDAQTGPVSYTIYYSAGTTIDFETAQTMIVPASDPFENYEFAEVTGLQNGQEYTFAVRATDSAPAPNEDDNTTTSSATPELPAEMPPGISSDANFDSAVHQGGVTTVENNALITVQGDLIIDGTLTGLNSDVCIEVFGDLFVNGTITVDGDDTDLPDDSEWANIKLICHGNYFFGETSVVGGEANIWIVDDAGLIVPTQDIVTDTQTDANPELYPVSLMPEDESGTSGVSRAAAAPTRRASATPLGPFPCRGFVSGNWGVIPTPRKGVKRIVLNINAAGGNLTFMNFSVTGPKGRKGTDDIAGACTATGGKGENAFSCRINVGNKLTFNNVTINLGDGGDGGDAVAGPCCPVATATGGNGGKSGQFRATAGSDILILGTFTLNPGKGGNGGNADATGLNGVDGCPCTDGCDAVATGGDGRSESKKLSARGNVNGLINMVLGPLRGGDGGTATAFAGFGGSSTCCPAGTGCMGGTATATGGKGGDSTNTNAAGVPGGGAMGGAGGAAAASGGNGGDGASCDKFTPGGDGGPGGAATADGGLGGAAAGDGPLTDGATGQADASGGDGGNGGDGCLPGGGGAGGTATANGIPATETDGVAGTGGILHCPILFCIDIPTIVPDPGTSGPIPDGFSGNAVILDDTLSQVGIVPFIWVVPGLTQVFWDHTEQRITMNANSDPANSCALRLDYGNIQWDIPQPNVIGWQTGVLAAQGLSTAPGQMAMLNASNDVLDFQNIPTIPPQPEPVPIELVPLTLQGVTYRQSAAPLCTVVFETIYIIDP